MLASRDLSEGLNVGVLADGDVRSLALAEVYQPLIAIGLPERGGEIDNANQATRLEITKKRCIRSSWIDEMIVDPAHTARISCRRRTNMREKVR